MKNIIFYNIFKGLFSFFNKFFSKFIFGFLFFDIESKIIYALGNYKDNKLHYFVIDFEGKYNIKL